MQATCEEEMYYYREMGFTNPVAIIPNPVELEPVADAVSKPDDIKRFGYLGRIHPAKTYRAFDRLLATVGRTGRISDNGKRRTRLCGLF